MSKTKRTKLKGTGTVSKTESTFKPIDSAKRVTTCHIVSGALMECAGTIRRVRWALDGLLTPGTNEWMEKVEAELFAQAVSSETEATMLASGTQYALAAGKIEESEHG